MGRLMMQCIRVLARRPAVVGCRFQSTEASSSKEKSGLPEKPKQKKTAIDFLREKGIVPKKGEIRLGVNAIDEDWKNQKPGLFQGRWGSPTSLNYQNPRGVDFYNPEMPLKDLVEGGGTILKEHTTKLLREIAAMPSIEKPEVLEDLGLVRHNECRIEWRFDSDEAMSMWRSGCDSDWKEGYSSCEFFRTDRGTAIFRGHICTQPIRDGKHERAGWASIRIYDLKAFLRKKYFGRWKNFSHLLIRCRGDGRHYKVMLNAPGAIDVNWFDAWSHPLHTHGGPYWQMERVAFSRFFHTVGGRIQDMQYPVPLHDVSSVSIVLMDRVDGDFQLELDAIGVIHDRSHMEKFAYESYNIPLIFSSGI